MSHGICVRVRSIAILVVIVLSILQTVAIAAPIQVPQAQPTGPRIWLGERQQLPLQAGGATAGAALLGAHAAVTPMAAQPLSLTTGDVDEDGIRDLLVGYAGYVSIQRGNIDAFAPQSDASFQAIAHGQFPAPFLAESITLVTPVNPDFMAVGHFTASGHNDLVIAAKGGSALIVFTGDGKGNFTAPQTINLPGGVTAMLGGYLGHATGFNQIIVGINGKSGPELAVFNGSKDGLDPVAAFPLSGAASSLNFADFGDGNNDLAFLAGGKVQILRGSTMQLQQISLPITATALAVGSFVIDRVPGLQLALLTADGTIHIAAHNEFDPRAYTADEVKALGQSGKARTEPNPLLPARVFPVNGWKIVEDINAAATFAAGQPPVMFRTRISDHQMDDVMVLNGSTGQLVVVQHPDVPQGATTFAPAILSTRPYSGNPLAAIPARTNIDGRAGILSIHQGESTPSVLQPLPDPTFFVNRTDDPVPGTIAGTCNNISNTDTSSSCSLREAIRKANDPSNPGMDTVMLAAGTYTLTQPRNPADHHTSLSGTLEVQDSLNIVGAGQNTTIIQGGTSLATSVDKVISFNQDIDSFTNATVSVQNLTIQNGNNRGDCCATQDGFGGAFDFDTGGNGTPGSGNATLTMTNVTIQNNAVTNGQGGGFTMFNTLSGTGFATLSNVIVQNNDATAVVNATTSCCGDGGGGVIDARSHIVMSNVQVLTNHTHATGTVIPTGGGLFFSGQHTQPQSHITGGSISGNTAAGKGGGMNSQATLLIDGSTLISNNTAGDAGAAAFHAGGGGIANDASDGLTLNNVTITGNTTTGNGGGLFTGDGSGLFVPGVNGHNGTVTITASRFAGNTASTTPGSSNVYNVTSGTPNQPNPVSATKDWWGTNVPSTTIFNNNAAAVSSCPASTTTNANAFCFDPFIVLTHHASPEKIRINGTTTLTGDMSTDNHGTAILAAGLTEIVGLPITFASGPLGSIPQAQPETLNASAQATATFNAGGTSGRANPTAKVDQETAPALDSLISSATEVGTTATITTVGAHGYATGETAVISGVGVGGYNGTFIITATPTVNTFTYTAGTSGLAASSGGDANVGIVILEPPQITKSFGAASIPVNGTTTVSFSINNPNVVAINGSFTDTLPVGLQVASTPGVTNTCGGTVTAAAGSGSISFSNNLTPVGVCTITVNITGTVDNIYTNSVQILSTDAGNGNTSSANLTVINPPTIAKAFGAATIPLNGTTSLTFTVSSTNVNLTLNGIAFTDSLTAGLVVASTPNLSNTCGGTATAAAGSSSVSLSGATLAPGTSCTVSVSIQGTTAGVKPNSVQASSTNGGTGNTSNASITVVAPPTISKAFGAASIPLNGSTSLSFTISNPNTTVGLSGVAFSDTLPAGLVIATPNGLTGTCGTGTITATQNTGVISLSGGTIAASGSCTFSVNVTGIAAGAQSNTTSAVTSTEGGTGASSNTAVLDVVAPPSIAKAFNPSSIALNTTTLLTFTITNPAGNVDALTGVAFTDTLPTGLTVVSGTSTVCGGTLTTTAPTGISLTGATVAASGQCQFSVTVTGATAGQYTNTTGAVTSTNGGTGNTASANLTVVAPPVVAKAFNPTTIPLNGTTTLTITITNPAVNTVALSPVTLNDILPTGLTVASAIVSDPCGLGSGILHTTAPTTIQIGGVTIPANGQCVVNVTVTGAAAGQYTNTTGTVSSGNGGSGNTASANLTVVAPATIAKAFGAGSIPLNGTTTVTFTINNPNTAVNGDLTGVAFSDTLPVSGGPGSATLVVAATPGVVNTCGGTVTATAGTGVISLSGASVAHNSSCTLTVNVTGTVAGDANNTTGAISSTQGGTGATSNTATLKVVAPPTISKAFGAASISLNGTTTVTFTITNPAVNTSAENGIAFSDTLTNGLQVASTPGVSNTCGGTVTAATSSTSISLTGGSIATPGSTCTIVVNVTGTQSGTVTNTTGAVSSTNGGTGATSNTATLVVASPPSITKTFGAASIPVNGTTSLTFNIQNPNTNVTLNGVAFTDTLPAGLVIASTPNLTNSCSGTATATAGSGSVSLSAGTIATSASCTVSVNVTGTTAGVKTNSVTVSSTEGGTGNTSTASITVVATATIAKAFGAGSIPLNGTTTVTFTISNPNAAASGDLTGVAFSDTLPVSGGPGSATMVVAATPGVVNTCGGTVTATAGTGVISLSGGSVAHNSSCTLTVNVTGTVEGDANNTTGAVSSTEGGTGSPSNTATLKVVAPPTISKAFGAASISLNGTTTVTFTITNPASNTSAENGIAFSDTLTNGLQVASTPGVTNSCGGTVTAAANSTSISLTGGSIATPGATCTIVVNVTGTQSGTVTNTTGAVSSTNGGTGATSNTATLIVASPATVTKSFGATKIPLNGTTSLTINISNPNTNVSLTGVSFTDNLPAGLVIAATPNLTNSCGGAATATAGSGAVSLSGGTVASSASCAVTVNVTGTTAGDKLNSVQVTSAEGGTSATASATVTVVGPPTIAKAFGAASIPLNGTTTVTFTISNPNNTATPANGDLTGVAFSDTLPVSGGPGTATLVVAATPGVVNTCGGTVTATAGTGVISLSGASVAHNSSCTLTVNVTGTVAGDANNTTGAITSTEGGTGATSNTATLSVVAPPSIAKVFNPSNIALNATTSLTFTITNPAANAAALNGVAFTDTLPTGLTVASGTSTVCGGTLTTTNPTGIALTGATIAAGGTCQFSVTVTGAAAGQFTNTTGNVTSTNGGTGNTATANLTVATPPTITKAFGAASILLNASTSLTFNISNPNASLALTGISFSDALPAGLVVATPSGLASNCGGTATAAAGSGSISLTGGSLAANGSCTISLNVTGVQAGVQNNTTGPISSNESGAGATSNTASITVIGPPSIAKAFGAASINLNGTTTLTFTITNPNATVALTGVGFGDTLPAGLTIANPNGLTGSCGAGTITTGTVSGFSVVNLANGTIAAGGSCTFSVNVVGTTGGHKVNTTGTVSSSNAGSGNQATATIDVEAPDLAITKTHSGTFTRGQTGAQWTITVSNVGFGPTVGTVTVVDTLPAVVNPPVPTAISGTGWTCTLATLTCTRADALPSGSSYPAITLTVNIPKNIQNPFTNTAKVSGGGDVNPNNNTATDKINLGPPIVMTPQSNSVSVVHGSTVNEGINVDAPDPTLGLISFTCSGLPSASTCNFSPASIDPAVTPGPTAMTVSVITTQGTASLSAPPRHGSTGRNPLYAMFALPAFGMVLAGFGGQRKKGMKRWPILLMLGLVLLLAMAGCGVAPPAPPPVPGTPAGSFSVTVTATSTGFTATTSFTLIVQ